MGTVRNYGRSLSDSWQNTNEREQILSLHGKETPLDIATELNEYFANIDVKLAQDIRPSQINLSFNNKPDIPFFELQMTTPAEVCKIMMSISDSKVTGDDGVPIRFIKMCSEVTYYLPYYKFIDQTQHHPPRLEKCNCNSIIQRRWPYTGM